MQLSVVPRGARRSAPGLDQMMEELGPDVVMQALEEIIGGLGKPKKRRRRAGERDIDAGTGYLPF